MASNGASPSEAVARVVAAYEQTTKSNLQQSEKAEALQYLEAFQKSPEAWTMLFEMLQLQTLSGPVQMFAATSLKGKMIHDVHQLPRDALPQLRQSLFDMMLRYQNGPKPVRTQLSISLAHLAIQMLEWKDVLPMVISTFSGKGPGATSCFLEFLNILAEELTEGRKITLTEDELNERTKELLQDNVDPVFGMLSGYAATPAAVNDTVFIACVQAWTKEISLSQIADSPIMASIFNALGSEDAFDAAVECIVTMIRETGDVDDSLDDIRTLLPLVLSLRPKIALAAEEEDIEVFKGLGRIFSECGEKWVVLISREPRAFRPLVESILQICTLDWEKEAIGYTFQFWEDLKLWLVLERYQDAREVYLPLLSKLVDVMIQHLQYPSGENVKDSDLFDGNREQEERFRNYRHDMGNVLKDCCEVMGPSECLTKTYNLIEAWVAKYGSQATTSRIPYWQELEAPIFALRAMGQTVSADENVMLPRLIPLLVQIPDHEKIRYQAVMALGRYTEWTAQHPDTLEMQLQFIMASFDHSSSEVVRGATLAFQYFCTDCAELLKGFFEQIHSFYIAKINQLPDQAQIDVSEGMAAILAKQPVEHLYERFKLCCDPILQRVVELGQNASDEKTKFLVADKINLITTFIQKVQPQVEPTAPNPAVKYCQEILPILSELASNFQDFVPILERVCRCWRYMVLSYRTSAAPMLPDLAAKLVAGFQGTKQGCFLWATDSIVREFSEHQLNDDDGVYPVDPSIVANMVPFWEQQAGVFLNAISGVEGEQLPDLIEDFFRLCMDMLLHHTTGTIRSQFLGPVLSAAVHSLSLLKTEVLMVTLHFLRDLINYGLPDSPSSQLSNNSDRNGEKSGAKTPTDLQARIKGLLNTQGQTLAARVLTGMMYSFPGDCIADASGVVLDLLKVLPNETARWIGETLLQLPAGHIRPHERERLVAQIDQRMRTNDMIKIRILLQDFTSSYRRRNVAPREGLGMLEPSKFVYTGA